MKHETLEDQNEKNAVNSRRLRKESAKHQQANSSKKRTLLEVEHCDIENQESDDDDEEELDDEDDYIVSPLTTVVPPNSSNPLIEAKLVFDPVHADPVDTEEQEEVIVQTHRYFKLLISVLVFDGLAITASLIGVAAIFFVQNHPTGKWGAIVFGYIPADCFLFISTILYSVSMWVAARDPAKQLMLRTGFGALVGATLGLLVAIVLLWKVRTKLGFVLMVIAFALTIVSFYWTLLLRKQMAQQEGGQRRCYRVSMVVAILVILFLLTYGTWTYESDLPIDNYPDCVVPNDFFVGDGVCDGLDDPAYATEACGFDGGDCRLTGENCLSLIECASGFCDPNTRTCQ